MACATLPSSHRFSPVRPWEPTTIKSAPHSFASSTITERGSPSRTAVSVDSRAFFSASAARPMICSALEAAAASCPRASRQQARILLPAGCTAVSRQQSEPWCSSATVGVRSLRQLRASAVNHRLRAESSFPTCLANARIGGTADPSYRCTVTATSGTRLTYTGALATAVLVKAHVRVEYTQSC